MIPIQLAKQVVRVDHLVRRTEWAKPLPTSIVVPWLLIVAAALSWGWSRARHMGLRVDHKGVKNRVSLRGRRAGAAYAEWAGDLLIRLELGDLRTLGLRR